MVTKFSKTEVRTLLREILFASPELVSKYPDGTVNSIDDAKFHEWVKNKVK